MASLTIFGHDPRGRQSTSGFRFATWGVLALATGAVGGFRFVIQRKTLQVQSGVHGRIGRLRLEF